MAELKGREKQIVDERIKKIAMLREEGINPYAHRFDLNDKRVYSVDVKEEFGKLENEGKSGKERAVPGFIELPKI